MNDQPVPLTAQPWKLRVLAGGYDRKRGCFVAIEEVPTSPSVFEDGIFVRGDIVVQGPVRLPADGIYMASPVLAALLLILLPEQVQDLVFLSAAPEGPRHGFKHIGNWPPGRYDGLADLEERGLVERKPLPKSAVRKRPWARVRSQPTYWRLTPEGRKWISENPERVEASRPGRRTR